jgi:NADPH:quinone reductase-like Zn-dependent oxidoreductase
LQGVTVGSRVQQLAMVRAIEANLGNHFAQPSLRPVLDGSFPLEQLGAAFQRQVSGQHFGKIGITI